MLITPATTTAELRFSAAFLNQFFRAFEDFVLENEYGKYSPMNRSSQDTVTFKELLEYEDKEIYNNSIAGNWEDWREKLRFIVVNGVAITQQQTPAEQAKIKAYLKQVLIHKQHVWQAGCELYEQLFETSKKKRWLTVDKLEFYCNLYRHDLSKFSSAETLGYAFHDFSSKAPDPDFDQAWLHHKNHNPHHPEYWMNTNRSGEIKVLEMPDIYLLEMVADWIGAGRTYGSTLKQWLPQNIEAFRFATKTAAKLRKILQLLGFDTLNIKAPANTRKLQFVAHIAH